MKVDRQHEVIRDATLTFAHVLKTQLPPRLEGKKEVQILFDIPDQKTIEKSHKDGKVLLSILLVDAGKSTSIQTTEQPILREEDEDGNIVESRAGPPTYVMPRYLITPWSGDTLIDQVVIGLIMNVFFSRPAFMPEDIQGDVIKSEPAPQALLIESFTAERQMQLWRAMGHNYRPSLVYGVNLRMDSYQRTVVRRVKERILDFKKLEG